MAKPAHITAVKGFRDVLPDESARWRVLEAKALDVFSRYAFEEIRVPLAEKTELFARSIGASTDIVEKEMYTFVDRGGQSITLRPEATASVVRAAIENRLVTGETERRLFYRGAMFRRERPQKGRFRQFYQLGAEVLGRDDPLVDAEVLSMLHDLLAAVGARGACIRLNSLGDSVCRPGYRELLQSFAAARRDALCANCQRRLDRNPLRLLDCKVETCVEALNGAPLMVDHLCLPCARHFGRLQELLSGAGVEHSLDSRIVRGLDYYCRTAFEIRAPGLGSQNAIGGGGRYDGLVAELGGPGIAGIGFALGVERLATVAEQLGPDSIRRPIFVAPLEEAATPPALRLASSLRAEGERVEITSAGRSLRSVMRQADRGGARHVIIIGPNEMKAGKASVRDMEAKADHPLSVDLDTTGLNVVEKINRVTGAAG